MRALVAQIGMALAALAEPVLIPPVGGEVTGPFTYEPYEGGRAAITLACEPGEAVRAPASGAVTFVGEVAGRTAVTIATVAGWRTTVGLLELGPVPSTVHSGDELGACPPGAEISLSLRLAGAYVDPEPALQSGRLRLALWLGGPESRPTSPAPAKYSSPDRGDAVRRLPVRLRRRLRARRPPEPPRNRYFAGRNRGQSGFPGETAREILKGSVLRGAFGGRT